MSISVNDTTTSPLWWLNNTDNSNGNVFPTVEPEGNRNESARTNGLYKEVVGALSSAGVNVSSAVATTYLTIRCSSQRRVSQSAG